MNNEEKIKKIDEWQTAGFVHEMTCTFSSHGTLIPVIEKGEVILKCDKCSYTQKDIPEVVLKADIEKMKKNFEDKGLNFKV